MLELDLPSAGMQSYACVIHGPITFPGSNPHEGFTLGLNDFIKALINTDAVQRLRWIRQNGLSHFVFNTMEHSRFTHSLGVAFVARRMIDRITLNSEVDSKLAWNWKYETIAAALLHDIGHGPFSHSLEEILQVINPELSKDERFDHEYMTSRLIREDTQVNKVLKSCSEDLPEQVAQFFLKKEERTKDHWRYRIVSSQLDADRLDYILRDSRMAGLMGVGYDLDRIVQHLYVRKPDDPYFILDRKAIEALESALLANDQLYRAVYYHRKVRAATAMLQALLLRVADLAKENQKNSKELFKRENHPLLKLIKCGRNIDLKDYLSLTENHIWALIEEWREHPDSIVKDYANRLWYRNLHATVDISGHDDGNREEKNALQKLTDEDYLNLGQEKEKLLKKYYVLSDTSRRKTYKEGDSIYLGNQKKPSDSPSTLEFDQSSRIISMLREQHKIEYVIYPHNDKNKQDADVENVKLDEDLAVGNGISSLSLLETVSS
ncbi:HD domain-containing protein [Pseudanabaena sp. UWO310]|uniref:HD domain-containing protein n=1 Tax=Pseudanabaena sp. UWO310 TaxID=2480795 RepID=UPI00115C1AEE|nr:HD domain-containing protein [Pseudanabaena sp. UWO310]TYQ31007.1 HD domain-containing protein [Pseudanabaena sp. UWO310]